MNRLKPEDLIKKYNEETDHKVTLSKVIDLKKNNEYDLYRLIIINDKHFLLLGSLEDDPNEKNTKTIETLKYIDLSELEVHEITKDEQYINIYPCSFILEMINCYNKQVEQKLKDLTDVQKQRISEKKAGLEIEMTAIIKLKDLKPKQQDALIKHKTTPDITPPDNKTIH